LAGEGGDGKEMLPSPDPSPFTGLYTISCKGGEGVKAKNAKTLGEFFGSA